MLRFGTAAVVWGLIGVAGVGYAGNPPADAIVGDLAALQGYWKPLSVVCEDKTQMSAEEMKKVTAVFDQAEYHLYHVERSKEPPVVRKTVRNVILDPTTSPKSITFEITTGDHKGQRQHGVYEVAGNQLKLCYGPADRPRPTQFAAPAGSGLFLEVWAKQPK